MAGAFFQIYIHAVFAVRGRQNLLHKNFRSDVFSYMAGIIENKGHKSIIVNGVEDHVHLFIGYRPSGGLSDLIRDIKNNTSNYINRQNWIKGKFAWQEGYGAFSYSKSHIENVYNYILNQEEHHRKSTFKEEFVDTLKKYDIDFEEKYLFDWVDDNNVTPSGL